MNNKPFIYESISKATADLELFSKMNMNEDKPLYLAAEVGGWEIRNKPVGAIEAIALNGRVFN